MKYDGILFDLDGTLWNATEAIAVSWQMALRDEPDIQAPPTVSQLEGVMGMAPLPLMSTLFPYLSEKRCMDLFDKCCEVENAYVLVHGGKLYEGLEDMLRELSRRVPLFVVSNCNDGYITCFMDAHGLRGYFKDWECIGKTGLQKWENIKLVAQRNGLQSPVYVGDTELDRESAEKAGVPFIHAAYGFGQAPGAVQIRKPMELLDLV